MVVLKNLPSSLSLAWLTVVVPAACKWCCLIDVLLVLTRSTGAEVIVLRLQELPTPRPYLYSQIFAGCSYLLASGFVFALWQHMKQERSQSLAAE